MHTATRTKARTRSVTAKVTPREEALLRKCSEEQGLTLSEWLRQVALQGAQTSPEARLLLSELLSLRMIVLRLNLDQIGGEEITEARVKEILDRAEASKLSLAEQRIQAFRSQPVMGLNGNPSAEAAHDK